MIIDIFVCAVAHGMTVGFFRDAAHVAGAFIQYLEADKHIFCCSFSMQ